MQSNLIASRLLAFCEALDLETTGKEGMLKIVEINQKGDLNDRECQKNGFGPLVKHYSVKNEAVSK